MMDRVQNKPNSCVQHTPSSESFQVHQVLKSELSAIRCACSSVEEGYEPKVTFLVVVKGHHTRFFPRDEDAEGENRNVPVGTVVDREITHPTEVQFYLLSQIGLAELEDVPLAARIDVSFSSWNLISL
ncbi:protein argonaute 11-like [Cryptotermes secundus]|uniref:protein argonaute 11-like n=1 Tax=Cryptotermes secundus TaxID=105785 RepID=UPI000CD7DF1C|nr:protein argonaute 11-like [Cryptotermes secundus]